MTPKTRERLAVQLWQEGLEQHLSGNLEEALRLYNRSLEVFPTAEAHVFLGWGLSHEGRFPEAIAECERALEIDSGLGNAYNDIGAYLDALGREDEAIRWFRRAKDAPRYDNPQFPYLNLARIYIGREEWGAALIELQIAEVLAPHDPRVDMLIARIVENLS